MSELRVWKCDVCYTDDYREGFGCIIMAHGTEPKYCTHTQSAGVENAEWRKISLEDVKLRKEITVTYKGDK